MTFPVDKKNTFKGEVRKDANLKPVPVVQIVMAMLLVALLIWALDHSGIIQFTNIRPE